MIHGGGRSPFQGAREDFSAGLGAMQAAGSSATPHGGNFVGQAQISGGAANNTGGFLSAGMPYTIPAALHQSDFIAHYHLTVLSSAAAAGGVNFRFVFTGGGGPFAIGTAFGNAGSLTAFKNANFANANVGPFCTFDCSGVAIIGAGFVDISLTIVGVTLGGTVDLQFQNVVGAETYTVGPDSNSYLLGLNG